VYPEPGEIPPAPEPTPFASMPKLEVPRPAPPGVEYSPTVAAPPETPTASTLQPGLTAWIIQVGSFARRETAADMVARLRQANFQTQEPEQVQLGGKTLFRVRVGPMLDKDKAHRLLPEINRISNTEGKVFRYP